MNVRMLTLKRLSILDVELTGRDEPVTVRYVLDGVEGAITGDYGYFFLARPSAEYVPGHVIEVSNKEGRFLYDAFPDTFQPYGILKPVQREEWDYQYTRSE